MDKRQHPRAEPANPVRVMDALTEQQVGNLGNVSVSGLMLIAAEPIKEDLLLQLRFTLTDDGGEPRVINVGAESLWCSPASQAGTYWVGFHITEIDDDDRTFLESYVS